MIMTDNKNGEIILCSGIKLDRNYENVLSYNEESMVSLCRNNSIYEGSSYSYMGEDYIDIKHPYASAMYANYVAFINPSWGNKWFFAWVTDVDLLNPTTSRIYIKMDVFSTWYSRFNIGQAFIEREHVSDDTIGKHTIPEGLETGEYICSSKTSLYSNSNSIYICVMCTKVPSAINVNQYVARYNGVYSGTIAVLFDSEQDDGLGVSKFLKIMDNEDMGDAVTSIFVVPKALCGNPTFGTVTVDGITTYLATLPYSDTETLLTSSGNISKPSSLNGYTPKNNKMWCWPYNYFYVTNNVGVDAEFRYEDFINNTPSFKTIGSLTPGCSIKTIPLNYKGLSDSNSYNSYNYGISGAKYPICSWQSDVYTNWLTQNGVNLVLSGLGSVGSIIGGSIALATGAGATVGLASIAGGVAGIGHSLTQVYEHSVIPPQAKGNSNSGDVTFSANKMDIPLYKMTIKQEYAVTIDRYFSRFGYKVNEVKTPSLTSRTKFNYIKVGGLDELIHGNIPSTALEEINSIFRKGVTIFHNYNDIGNYTIDNPIAS